jgi:hypothetical protein
MIRTFSELRRLPTFEERYEYLRLKGIVGESTFGFDRYLNQLLYRSDRWRKTRNAVIVRDNGCDLGIEDRDIPEKILVHHMNPITMEDIEAGSESVFDSEFLICTSDKTHNAIHFSDINLLPKLPVERKIGDTCPWK